MYLAQKILKCCSNVLSLCPEIWKVLIVPSKLSESERLMKSSIKQWFFKLKYVIALAVFVIAIGFVGESSVVNRIAQQHEISRLKGEIDEYNRKFEQDRKTLNALKHDPDAVKEVARSRYFMKTDNEDIFIVEDDEE